MTLRTVDLQFRNRDYRLAESQREDGHARVTYLSPTSLPMECSECGRVIHHGMRLVMFSIHGYHPGCAIRVGALVETGESIADRMLADRDHDQTTHDQRPSGAGRRADLVNEETASRR